MELILDNKKIVLLLVVLCLLLVGTCGIGWMAGKKAKPDSAAVSDKSQTNTASSVAVKGAAKQNSDDAPPSPKEAQTPPAADAKAAADAQKAGATATADAQMTEGKAAAESQKTAVEDKIAALVPQAQALQSKTFGAQTKDAQKDADDKETSGQKGAAAGAETSADQNETADKDQEDDVPMAYSVQIGTFVVKRKAEQLVASLEEKELAGTILYGKNHRGRRYYIVQISDFPEYEAAIDAAKQFEAKEKTVAVVEPLTKLELKKMKKAPPPEKAAPAPPAPETAKAQSADSANKPQE